VEIEQTVNGRTHRIPAVLQDLSRDGYQVKTLIPLDAQEPLTLELCIEGSQIDLRVPGTVRWQRPGPEGTWLAGCQADCALEWETLGELFLAGVLSPDAP
jgi:hypothetical protein